MIKLLQVSQFRQEFYYIATEKDTIEQIAQSNHTTPSLIIEINNLTERIKCGDLLFIKSIEGQAYTVKVGDTLESLCNGNKAKITKIKSKNAIEEVYIGQKIFL